MFRFSVRMGLILLLLVAATAVSAQAVQPTQPVDPNANISFPPPVYTLRGLFPVRGSANVADMRGYFLEYRALNEDLTPQEENVSWTPATTVSQAPVLDDLLGEWDTTLVEDGLYELRLRILPRTGETVSVVVSPLRIENEIPPFLQIEDVNPAAATATAFFATLTAAPPVATQPAQPPLQATPTPFDPSPRVTAPNLPVNVRQQAGVNFSTVGSLAVGESAPIIGLTDTFDGRWYRIELPNGTRGWVAGGVVTVTGNLQGVPVLPPPITPTPTLTPTPPLPDIAFTGLRYDRGAIKQGEAFQIIASVTNLTGVFMPDVPLLCTFRPQNVEFSTNVGGLNGFESRDVVMTARLDTGGGNNVTLECGIDPNNIVQELNNNNNFFSITTPLGMP
jgi:uncharacterized protein YgiM (DUF1202 family)